MRKKRIGKTVWKAPLSCFLLLPWTAWRRATRKSWEKDLVYFACSYVWSVVELHAFAAAECPDRTSRHQYKAALFLRWKLSRYFLYVPLPVVAGSSWVLFADSQFSCNRLGNWVTLYGLVWVSSITMNAENNLAVDSLRGQQSYFVFGNSEFKYYLGHRLYYPGNLL
jgi:hypothetical protein